MEEIILGNKVKDIVSGVEGIAISKCEFLNGCIQYALVPKVKLNATVIPSDIWIDEAQLKVTGQGIAPNKTSDIKFSTRSSGGGYRSHPSMQ